MRDESHHHEMSPPSPPSPPSLDPPHVNQNHSLMKTKVASESVKNVKDVVVGVGGVKRNGKGSKSNSVKDLWWKHDNKNADLGTRMGYKKSPTLVVLRIIANLLPHRKEDSEHEDGEETEMPETKSSHSPTAIEVITLGELRFRFHK